MIEEESVNCSIRIDWAQAVLVLAHFLFGYEILLSVLKVFVVVSFFIAIIAFISVGLSDMSTKNVKELVRKSSARKLIPIIRLNHRIVRSAVFTLPFNAVIGIACVAHLSFIGEMALATGWAVTSILFLLLTLTMYYSSRKVVQYLIYEMLASDLMLRFSTDPGWVELRGELFGESP